jgi:hypothetical protein
MSMSNYAGLADVIEESFIEEICSLELRDFREILKDNNYDLPSFAMCANYGNIIDEIILEDHLEEKTVEEIINIYDILCSKFKEVTKLELNIGYHEAEDRADEVNGVYWFLDGVYQYSPAGEKYKSKIERKFWTTFG